MKPAPPVTNTRIRAALPRVLWRSVWLGKVLDWAEFCILVQIRIGHSPQYGRFLPGLSGSSRKLRVQPIFGPPRWAGLGPCPDASARDPNLPKHCPRLVTYQRGRPR